METQENTRLDMRKINFKRVGVLAMGIALAATLTALCITIGIRSNIQSKYSSARDAIGENLYTELYMFCQAYDQISVPGADVQDVILPSMKDYYLAARTLNTALNDAFGESSAVLTDENLSAIDAAFEAYDAAFRAGRSTDDAQAAMTSCIQQIRTLLDTRYSDGVLRVL